MKFLTVVKLVGLSHRTQLVVAAAVVAVVEQVGTAFAVAVAVVGVVVVRNEIVVVFADVVGTCSFGFVHVQIETMVGLMKGREEWVIRMVAMVGMKKKMRMVVMMIAGRRVELMTAVLLIA